MNATITSNAPGGASGFEKNGPGMLTLAGASSIITGSMLVNAGGLVARNARFDEIAVADGALFGGSGSAASLVVGTGGTLQAGYPGTASTLDISGTLTLGAGVTLNYSILAGNQSGTLAAGYASLIAAASDYTLNLDDWLAGAYDLGNVTALAGADVKLDGRDLDVRKTYSYDTSGGRLALTIDQIANRTLVWNGTSAISADDGRWSAVAENWVASDDSTQSLIFTHYDAVFFDDRVSGPARRTIDLADNRQVSDIFVAGAGDYTFTGSGAITADASGAHNHTGGGKLVKTGGGTLTLANTGGNHFAGGVDIGGAGAAGGAIVFDRAGQLAIDADAAITFYSTGTLRHVSQNALILNANIIIAGNATATLDTGAADLTLAGGIAAGDASGTLVKTGANTLLVTSTSVGASGLTLDTSAGSTLLDGGWFSGTLYARGGAVVGGAGYAATITTAPGGALQVGRLDGFGTLSALTLALGDGAVLNYTIPAAGQSAKLEAANVNLAAAAANYTFNFTDWYSGTYDLGNVTALAGATITLNGYDLNRRQQSSYDTTGGRLRLIIDPMDNMLIVWGGASASVSGDGQWNIIHENWFAPDDATTSQPFAPGDAVLFDDRVASDARRVVTIATSLTAYSVEFSGTGRYGVIGGGSIITDAPESGDLIAGVESSSRGKLVKTGDGSVVFTNTGGNHFAAGIDLHAGIIAFTRADQIAVGGGAAINFLGAGTLQANAGIDASVPLATNIAIADAMTATIDTAGWTLVYSGSHILLGDTGTLAKTGIGTLLLTGTTRAAALTHRVIQGTLALDGADADSAVEVTSGAALSGNGIISGAVTTAAASTVRADSGLLHLASLRLVDGVSLAGTGTLGGAATLEGAVTARIPAGETLTLSGVNTGGGSLTKTGQGVLIYAGAASLGHAGGTQIDDGFVFLRNITGTDAASLTHTFTLNGGWLDLSDTLFENSGSGINDWSGIGIRQGAGAGTGGVMGQNDRITLGAGGMLANLGDGTTRGLFVVVDARDGTAILGGANLYAGYTRIDSGTLLVTADTQIGDPAFAREVILNGGVLQVGADFATSRAVELRAGGSVDVIAGVETTCGAVASATGTDAHLVKTGAGTLALSGLNEAAVTDIREGSLVALNAAGAGADVVNVSAGATLEYRDIASGTTPVSIAGSGTLRFEGAGVGANAIALTGSTTIAAIRLGGNTTVTVARDHALGTSESTIIIANGARLLLGSANVRLGHVNLVAGNGYLGFAAPVGKFKEATLTSLAGSGTLGFNVDLGARKADFLTIVNAPVGDHTIVIESTGTEPLRIDLPIAIAAMPDSDATFTLAGKRVEIGVYAFSLQSEVANARRTLSLAGASELSRMGNFIHTTAAAQWLAWYSELDSIQKRMGDLHANPAASGRINTWLRGYYQCFTYDEQATGEPFAERMFGTDAGFDVSFRNAATRATTSLGFYLGSGQTHRTFDNIAGDGWSDSACAGLYATFATRSAWHLDFVFKANRIDNRFEVHDVDFYGNRATIAGDYRDNVFGLSLELGKRLNLGKKWFFEPRIQGAGCLNPGSQYTTNNGVGVSLERGTATHALVGARLGRGTTYAGDHYLFYYVNFFGAREWNQYGRLTANGFRFDPKIVGDRIGGGLGINWIPCKGTQVHFGLDAVHAGYYDKSIGINFGFTQSW
jgi:outer membrane autotransporter protein